MRTSRHGFTCLLLAALLAACGGGGGDAGTPAAGPGNAPTAGSPPVGGTVGFGIDPIYRVQYGASASGSQVFVTRGVAWRWRPLLQCATRTARRRALPQGLVIDANTGVISGTVPTGASASGGSISRDIVMTVTRGSLSTEVPYGALSFYVQ